MKYFIFYGNYSSFYEDALYIRYNVFTKEQGFDSNIDVDKIDKYSWHIIVFNNNNPIGTGRLYYCPKKQTYSFGRICVLKEYRKQNIGFHIVDKLINKAKEENKSCFITISSQIKAVDFYKKNFNFITEGEEYLEDGQPHIKMLLKLKIRGFEKVSKYSKKSYHLPRRSTFNSAGYDLITLEDIKIPPKGIVMATTGVKCYMLKDEVFEIYIRSSIALKKQVICINNVGIIDSDYYNNDNNEGEIFIPLYNLSQQVVNFKKNERIAQGIFKKYLISDNNECENNLRSGGFGSTGKK